jgi:adenylate kinase
MFRLRAKTNNYPACSKVLLMKRVILVTGTPCVGKTTTAKALATKIGAQYINLTDYAKENGLTLGEDKERQTLIIDEEAMTKKLAESINASGNTDVIIDGHYAAAVTPSNLATHVFVLRRNPIELKQQMINCGFSEAKLDENLSAEILDSCLIEALENQEGKVCELDVSGQTTDDVVDVMLDVLNNGRKCYSGFVDWLGMLEREGLTDQYLRV